MLTLEEFKQLEVAIRKIDDSPTTAAIRDLLKTYVKETDTCGYTDVDKDVIRLLCEEGILNGLSIQAKTKQPAELLRKIIKNLHERNLIVLTGSVLTIAGFEEAFFGPVPYLHSELSRLKGVG